MDDAKHIVAFGEILWDLLPSGRTLGGAPFNFACRVNSLGDRGHIVSRVGRDDLGRQAVEAAEALGMDTAGLQSDDQHATGTVDVTFGPDGEPDYTINPDVAYDYIEFSPALRELAGRGDCICFGTLAQRSAISRATCEQLLDAGPLALPLLDINLRRDCYSEDVIRESLRRAAVLKLNDAEIRHLRDLLDLDGCLLDELACCMVTRFSLDACVVTLGPRGSLAATASHVCYVPGFAVEVVDTVGSGDAFTAGFVGKYLRDEAVEVCCRYGNAVGALVARQAGGTAPLCSADVEAFLASNPRRVIQADLKHLMR